LQRYDAAINPTTIWYKDADHDGYSDSTNVTQCVQPAEHYLATVLTAVTGDCMMPMLQLSQLLFGLKILIMMVTQTDEPDPVCATG